MPVSDETGRHGSACMLWSIWQNDSDGRKLSQHSWCGRLDDMNEVALFKKKIYIYTGVRR